MLFALLFSAIPAGAQGGDFTLVILHNNDGESQLIDAGGDNSDFGGVARFAALVDKLRTEAEASNQGVVLLSSGDNFLAGPEFEAGREELDSGRPSFDTTAIDLIGYDAMAIGNHEFDFGPDVLAAFITGFGGDLPFVSANLDLGGEPNLQVLADQGTIVRSLVIDEAGEQIGVVGATTPQLPSISSPRNVRVNPDVAGIIQAEVDALEGAGVNKIVVISHLQSANEDLDLAAQLRGVDVMIAGGGDELLANDGDLLVPGDEEPFGSYPLTATGADGAQIPVVTTPGDYKYVGRLVVQFDEAGNVVSVDSDSGLVRVAGGSNPDAVEPDAEIQAQVVGPVQAFVDELGQNVIATSDVALEGRRDPGVRTMETNEGNLMADALLWQANQLAGEFGVEAPAVALQNGGGLRNNNVIPAGAVSELTTFDIAPFSNFVTVVENIPPEQFKEIMENAVSGVEDASGRFAQIAGFKMVYDLSGTPQELDDDGNVVTAGTRVQEITLDDGTPVVQGGGVAVGAPTVNITTIDFLARGGDQYPFRDASFVPLGVSYQQALSNYIVDVLGGTISAAQYPEGGSGRITQVGSPAAAPDEAPSTLPQAGGTISLLPAIIMSLAGLSLTGTGLWLRRKK
jgi:5'-nucleotidase